jgi:hypothetical protein
MRGRAGALALAGEGLVICAPGKICPRSILPAKRAYTCALEWTCPRSIFPDVMSGIELRDPAF